MSKDTMIDCIDESVVISARVQAANMVLQSWSLPVPGRFGEGIVPTRIIASAADATALAEAAAPLAAWLLSGAIQALAGKGEGIPQPTPVVGGSGDHGDSTLLVDYCQPLDNIDKRSLAADVAFQNTDSVAGVNNRSEAQGAGAVMAAAPKGAA